MGANELIMRRCFRFRSLFCASAVLVAMVQCPHIVLWFMSSACNLVSDDSRVDA